MIKSPWSGSDFRDSILARLSPGEELVSFADCLEQEVHVPSWKKPWAQWYFLALTNINIRQGSWTVDESTRGPMLGGGLPSSRTVSNEISAMSSYAINDITTTSFSKAPVELMASVVMTQVLGKALWPKPIIGFPAKTQDVFHLTLTLANSTVISVMSPFVEFEELVASIDAARSGALIVENTAAAADALDQLVPLLNDGILTQEEFDRAKKGFLGATVEVRESSVGLLRQLHSLHKSGVLSESEFNLKKWNILSEDG